MKEKHHDPEHLAKLEKLEVCTTQSILFSVWND